VRDYRLIYLGGKRIVDMLRFRIRANLRISQFIQIEVVG